MAPAGYSGTPLPKKLGLREDHRLGLIGAPPGFDRTLGSLPTGTTVRTDLRGAHLVQSAGHWVHQEQAEETSRLLIDFLAGPIAT